MGMMKRIATAKLFGKEDVRQVFYGRNRTPSKELKKTVEAWKRKHNIK